MRPGHTGAPPADRGPPPQPLTMTSCSPNFARRHAQPAARRLRRPGRFPRAGAAATGSPALPIRWVRRGNRPEKLRSPLHRAAPTVLDTSAKAGSVEKDRSVHQGVRWAPVGTGTKAVSATHRLRDFAAGEKDFYPRKGTTPARGGGGGGRRVSAPGGRADTPSAQGRVMLTIHMPAGSHASTRRKEISGLNRVNAVGRKTTAVFSRPL